MTSRPDLARIREINDNCLKLKAFADARPEVHPDRE